MSSPSFTDADVPFALLRERAFNLRWATLPADVIPLTAADPDFAVAPCIREAIADYARGGVFSYGPAAGLPAFRQAVAAHRSASQSDHAACNHRCIFTSARSSNCSRYCGGSVV
jgi:bifunctional pyridoxal-dependent enzyme with beta-cystathionase and maltose regulon repressor activities